MVILLSWTFLDRLVSELYIVFFFYRSVVGKFKFGAIQVVICLILSIQMFLALIDAGDPMPDLR